MAINFPASPTNGQTHSHGGITYIYNGTAGTWDKVVRNIDMNISYVIDGAGEEITTGQKGTIEVTQNCWIDHWTMIADQSGSANVDMWSRDYSTTLPISANSVTDNIGMTISTATSNQSNIISNWRMNKINAGNVITYNVQSCSTITRLAVHLYGYKYQ